MNRGSFTRLGLVIVSLSACGTPTSTTAPFTPSTAAPTSIPSRLPDTTTTTPANDTGKAPPVDTDVSLAPDGAYPVLDQGTPTDDLKPGTYRIRLDFQTDWPEQCLAELIVLPPPDGSFDGSTQNSTLSVEEAAKFEQAAMERQDRLRELQEPICGSFWKAWEATWPSTPELPPIDPKDIAASTTTPK